MILTTAIGGAFVLISGLAMVAWIVYCYFRNKSLTKCLAALVLYWIGAYGIVHFM